jgi:hypothetical protein
VVSVLLDVKDSVVSVLLDERDPIEDDSSVKAVSLPVAVNLAGLCSPSTAAVLLFSEGDSFAGASELESVWLGAVDSKLSEAESGVGVGVVVSSGGGVPAAEVSSGNGEGEGVGVGVVVSSGETGGTRGGRIEDSSPAEGFAVSVLPAVGS